MIDKASTPPHKPEVLYRLQMKNRKPCTVEHKAQRPGPPVPTQDRSPVLRQSPEVQTMLPRKAPANGGGMIKVDAAHTQGRGGGREFVFRPPSRIPLRPWIEFVPQK
jgi:hypothetical protein